jgi:tripartite-type tricarboxylate transporter receptor subunit TctC
MAGQVAGMFGNLPEQLGAIKGGKTRALAVTSLRRNPQLPDVPTVAESGYPGFEVTVWYGVCTQSAVPKPILDRLHATLIKTLELPEMKARLAESSIEASPTTPEEFAAFIPRRERALGRRGAGREHPEAVKEKALTARRPGGRRCASRWADAWRRSGRAPIRC